jgi:hypothetical protein
LLAMKHIGVRPEAWNANPSASVFQRVFKQRVFQQRLPL